MKAKNHFLTLFNRESMAGKGPSVEEDGGDLATMTESRPKLSVILVQYDRGKYPNAVERLLTVVDGLMSFDATVVVVDNRHTSFSPRFVSRRLVHIGGNNSAWEFSAFDRGVRFLERNGYVTDLYVFVTDAFMAYGDDFLSLVRDHAARSALLLNSCIGWIDSIMQRYQIDGYTHHCHIRTSLLMMPAKVYAQVGPLRYGFDEKKIFTRDPQRPFQDDAPISKNLQDFLLAWLTTNGNAALELEEPWHSQFELTRRTFGFFRKKVLAILREFILSARLREAGIDCYDYRVLPLIDRYWKDGAPEAKERWQWLNWKDAMQTGEHHLDWVHFENEIRHGQSSELVICGWVKTVPQVNEVILTFGDEHTYYGSCNLQRDDQLPGFEMRVDLSALPPGEYEVCWSVPRTPIRRVLGALVVHPQKEFKIFSCCLSELAYDDKFLPASIEGELTTSSELERMDLCLGNRILEPETLTIVHKRSNAGIHQYHVFFNELLLLERPADLPESLALELHFRMANHDRLSWRHHLVVRPGQGTPHQISKNEIGRRDPLTGWVHAHVRGAIYLPIGEHCLELIHAGKVVGTVDLELDGHRIRQSKLSEDSGWVEFDQQLILDNVAAGQADFQLALRRAGTQGHEVLKEWQHLVTADHPVVHVDSFEVEPVHESGSSHLIRLSGWVSGHHFIRGLHIDVDGQRFATFGADILRPDLSPDGLARRQGFYFQRMIMATFGEHEVAVSTHGPGKPGIWRRRHYFPEPVPEIFKVRSEQLEVLDKEHYVEFYSSLVITGVVETQLKEVLVQLCVQGEIADEQIVRHLDEFSLRFVPEEVGELECRLTIKAATRIVYDSGEFIAKVATLRLPQQTSDWFENIVEKLEIGDLIGSDRRTDLLVRSLAEENIESLIDFRNLLEDCSDRLDEMGRFGSPEIGEVAELEDYDGPSLKILLASWEVPCLRHGGGVYIANLLKELGARHEITVVHPFSVDEVGWIDDIRPFVKKVVSVPRRHAVDYCHQDLKIPEAYYHNYAPALRRAIEAEIQSGDYDLVDYQYANMYHHMSKDPLPKVMTILELPYTAHLTKLYKDGDYEKRGVQAIDDLLKAFHFNTIKLPQEVRHLVTVTEADGRALARFQKGATVYVNAIGVDAERFRPADILTSHFSTDEHSFVFLGNYRHPPNLKAALFLAREVMPLILHRYPRAKLYILGSHPTSEIQRLASANIEVTGFVDDFRPYLWNADAFIAPIFTGSGMRVKVLETLACGCPVISTPLGMVGIGATDGVHYLEAESATDFAAAAFRTIEERSAARTMADKAKALVTELHSWDRKAREREAIWARAIAESRSQPAAYDSQELAISVSK